MSPLYRKIALRLVPFLMLLYMVAFLDRVNISFAALTMNRDLGISASLYGFAAGVFFLGYCLFEVPANLMLARIGARRWIASLVVAWGVVSIATAFVGTRPQYVAARFLLGVAESGFYPGVIFYLTLWLPRTVRSRVMAAFMMALPISSCLGSPISSHILLLHNMLALKGWQWLFLLEGSPAIVLGAATWFVLADTPAVAPWLTPSEKAQLAFELRADEPTSQSGRAPAWVSTARASVTYFLFSVALYGLSFWLPKLLVSAGSSTLATGWWTAVPYLAGAVTMLLVSRQRGAYWLPAMFLFSGMGFLAAALVHSLAGALLGLSVAASGAFASLPLFWSTATARMGSGSAGATIAIINSVGAIGGFTGSFLMGWLYDFTHSYSIGLWTIATCMVLGAATSAEGSSTREPTPL